MYYSLNNTDPRSASVATLIRLRFLADLEETDDILCPSSRPRVHVYSKS